MYMYVSIDVNHFTSSHFIDNLCEQMNNIDNVYKK